MPNTLAHFGVQTLISKGIDRSADFKWIAVGCILPDIPWILQRIGNALPLDLDPATLRLYAVIQASLFFSLLAAAALSLTVRRPGRLFLLLAGNCLLHLLLDATQIKWANGINLQAPFSWRLLGFNLFWPEQLPTLLLTGLGLVVLVIFALRDTLREVVFTRSRAQLAGALLAAGLYLGAPLLFFPAALSANPHYLATLTRQERSGQVMECDRCSWNPDERTLKLPTGERVRVRDLPLDRAGTVSIRGIFVDHDTIRVTAWHRHHPFLRDLASKIGLLAVLLLWIVAVLKKRCRVGPDT